MVITFIYSLLVVDMKTLLSLFSLILILAVPVFAQEPIQNLPILQEWYSWPGAYGKVISYLPNFKKNGGENAIVQGRKNNPTWFNRFAYDTVNQFSWKDDGANYIVRGDFNGDGFADAAVANNLGGVTVAFGTGGFSFQNFTTLSSGHGFERTAVEAKRIVFGQLDLEKPLICRLNGHAIGLGATLALCCAWLVAKKTRPRAGSGSR